MERAGVGVLDAMLATWPDLAEGAHRAQVWCGPGNNGGDGFVVARLLQARDWQVDVALSGQPDHLPPDAHVNYLRWSKIGPVGEVPVEGGARPDVIIDALFGIGLTRPLTGVARLWAQSTQGLPRSAAHIVAIDIPSGLCADTGAIIGATCVRADLTVTFHRAKVGHMQGEGPRHCGRLVIADIGL
jgi:hydroxyethylthiazole kinase-like uncharacterized protein yjeF